MFVPVFFFFFVRRRRSRFCWTEYLNEWVVFVYMQLFSYLRTCILECKTSNRKVQDTWCNIAWNRSLGQFLRLTAHVIATSFTRREYEVTLTWLVPFRPMPTKIVVKIVVNKTSATAKGGFIWSAVRKYARGYWLAESWKSGHTILRNLATGWHTMLFASWHVAEVETESVWCVRCSMQKNQGWGHGATSL